MNDKTIISAISTTYFIIVTFFSLIILSLFITFIILQNGLYIENLSIPNIQIKQLYIKWNEKIDISVKNISIKKTTSTSKNKIDYKSINTYFKKLSHMNNLFNSITIESIQTDNIEASFQYKQGEKGFITVKSDLYSLDSYLSLDKDILHIEINKLKDLHKNIKLNGEIFIDTKKLELYSKLYININNDINADIYIQSTQKILSYQLTNKKNIKSIDYIVNILKLPASINYWLLDAIDMEHLSIENISGFINFDKPNDFLQHLNVNATVHALNYTYHTKLDAIHTKTTKLALKKGIFFIRPLQAYTVNTYLDKSWLKIDFNHKEELLYINLIFDAVLNKDVLNILKTYEIDLPFIQNSGNTKTDLLLKIGLRNISVFAQGDFFIKNANFDYLGLNIDIDDSYIKLNNYDVTINKMHVNYKDIASSFVNIKYNAKTSKGTLLFDVERINVNKYNLSLKKQPLQIVYHLSPKKDTIDIKKSYWMYDRLALELDAISMPLNIENLILNIPTTFFKMQNLSTGYIDGKIDIKKIEANLHADVLSFAYQGIKLNQTDAEFDIVYKNELLISSKNEILLTMNDLDVSLKNTVLKVDYGYIQIHDTDIIIDNLLTTRVNAIHYLNKNHNNVNLRNLNIKIDDTDIYSRENLNIQIKELNNTLSIASTEIGLNVQYSEQKWQLKIDAIEKIEKDSKLLQDINITKGNISLYKQKNKKNVIIDANVDYPYKILLINSKAIDNYVIHGKLNATDASLYINNKVLIKLSDKIQVQANDVGIDLNQLFNLVNTLNKSSNDKNQSKNIILNSNNMYFNVAKNKNIISDSVKLQYVNNIFTLQLKHKDGSAGLKLHDNNLSIYGSNFNDEFMGNLFSLSKFKGGRFDFFMQGTLDDYDGLFYIKNTTMLDYKLLNNVLAFINTVPSLITFSLPGYSQDGFNIKTSYAKFHSKDNVINISEFLIDSKEMKIFGGGIADIKNNKVDITLNLKTDLGSGISKIPVVGYILLGEDSISTTLNVSGKLSNPDVKSLLARDIVVAPLNIIKRTILFPFKLINDVVGE